MEKYYTPAVEELFVGYEFEIKCWITDICDDAEEGIHYRWDRTFYNAPENWIFNMEVSGRGTTYSVPVDVVRTRYLTKEDIESLDLGTRFSVDKVNDGENQWQITDCEIPVYEGQIKSINELRKLMSWLNIK